MPTIDEIKAGFEEALQAIFLLDQTLAAERSALMRKAFSEGRPLTESEIERRREIAATRGELAETMEVLSLDTVNSLENSPDVDELLIKIEMVNKNLEDDLKHLKDIEYNVAKVEAAAKGLANLVNKLLDFKKSFV